MSHHLPIIAGNLVLILFSQPVANNSSSSNQKATPTPVLNPVNPVSTEEAGSAPVKSHILIRRKSGLPGDLDTVMALKQYSTVDRVLPPSNEPQGNGPH